MSKKAITRIPPPALVGMLHQTQVANLLGCNPAAVRRYELDPRQAFPRSVKFGRCVYYRQSAVTQWLAERLGDIAA